MRVVQSKSVQCALAQPLYFQIALLQLLHVYLTNNTEGNAWS